MRQQREMLLGVSFTGIGVSSFFCLQVLYYPAYFFAVSKAANKCVLRYRFCDGDQRVFLLSWRAQNLLELMM